MDIADPDERPGLDLRGGQRLGEHAPAQAGPDGGCEPLRGRHEVGGPCDVAAKDPAHQHVLQGIGPVPGQRRGRGRRPCGESVREPPLEVGPTRHRHIPHPAQRAHPAAGDRRAFGGHRAHHRPVAQQPGGVVLVLDPDIEQHVRQSLEHRGEPGRHRVGVDGDCHPYPVIVPATHFGQRLGLKHRRLRGQPQQGNPGRRRGARLLPHHQHLTDPLLQRLDPLADRRRRHMQAVRRRVEAAQFDHRGEGRKLFTGQCHISDANADEDSLAGLMRRGVPNVGG